MLAAVANEASTSRFYAGLHYRFDGDAGLELGPHCGTRRAGAARARGLKATAGCLAVLG